MTDDGWIVPECEQPLAELCREAADDESSWTSLRSRTLLKLAAVEIERLQKVENASMADYLDMLANERVEGSTDNRVLRKAAQRLRERG